MRFDALHLPAFGPFTDLRLEFPARKADFHLLYGPNEAGKSSLLRAIGDLLFEIPPRTTDNFLHSHKDMRLGGDLRSRAGRTLSIQRRKGNKNTLLAADDSPLPDDTLVKWLGHVDRDYFTTMFGLASEDLREGAAALLRGEGDLGKALFSASLGGTPVHHIQQALEDSARLLYAGRAKASIRASATAYSDEMKLAKDRLVKAEDWELIGRDLAEASQQQALIDEQRQALQKRCDWIQRCLDALPTLGKLHAKEQAIAGLPAVPQVPPSFISDARTALDAKGRIEGELHRCREEITRLQTLLGACLPREDLLEHESEIEALHHAASVYRDQCVRLAKKETELAVQEPELLASMREQGIRGGLDVLDILRLTAPEMARIKELADRVVFCLQQQETTVKALREKEAAISLLESKLAHVTAQEVSRVREALAQSAAAAEAQRTLDATQAETAKAEREMRSQQRLLPGAPADASAVHAMLLPSRTAASALQAAHDDGLRSKKALEDEQAETARALGKLRRELAQLERRGALPSTKHLAAAREQRETVWRKILSVWSTSDFSGSQSLVNLHEQTQKRADELADQLREHADLVAKADQLHTSIAEVQEDLATVAERLERQAQSQQQWQIRWEELWLPTGLEARAPEEMNEWRDQWLEFCRRFERWQSLNDALTSRQAAITAAEACLREASNDKLQRPFIVLFDEARRLVAKADKDEGARAALAQELAQARQERARLTQQREALALTTQASTDAWQRQAEELHLATGTSPTAGLDLLGQRRTLLQRFDAWKASRIEVQQLKQYTQTFEQDLLKLATTLKFETARTDVLDGMLWRSLHEAREAKSTQRKLSLDLATAHTKETALSHESEAATAKLAGLLTLASLENATDLEPLLLTLATHAKLTEERHHLCESLHGPARGEVLESFIASVQAEDREALPTEKQAAETELATLAIQRDAAIKKAVEAGQRQSVLKEAGDNAAAHRQRAESHAASLRTDSARYLRLRLATHFLEQQIERFRNENQAPLMKRASTLFHAITLGSFDGLTTGYADNDAQIIVGHRGDNHVPVTGMSEGTRDQLYLSLRLAAIERHIEVHEPLPLILDDLLMTFDDTRAAAVLPVLRDLSCNTQVLLFTHHEHLIDLCQRTLAAEDFTVHRLGQVSPTGR